MPVETNNITGIILAGGRGSRMGGEDKCLLSLKQRRLIDHVIEKLAPQTGEIIISANRNISDYQRTGYEVARDTLDDFQGPLAGIHSALQHVHTPYAVVVPCDCPLLDNDFVAQMYTSLKSAEVAMTVASSKRGIEPLFMLLETRLKEVLEIALQQGTRRVNDWIQQCNPVYTDFSNTGMFTNLNTPEELAALERSI